ncbi:NYN domain-containing protein [Roseicella aerolata]|uniref:NYN domain-containing protein n=1 Tax=Roseicella aerolata TaxID=2883479 RepID=A0A9X1L6N0_9PROT|nr:NYN domain-containing protein [Roseicella aerolata]MCB4820734.1 NYN domain-containing protein [Roseicella aerolata]
MPTAGPPLRAALYIDFDNVFSSLAAIDEWAAWSFATEPGRWLAWLESGADSGPRRLLVRRCYLNPAGWHEPEPGGRFAAWIQQPRVYYSRFRADFVRAGLQVVDCPRLARLKNGADMVMALDILDALAHPTHFQEFLILSGDSDFTPLLHRLRAHDRRSLVVTHPLSAQAFRAAADAVIGFETFAEATLTEDAPTNASAPRQAAAAPAQADPPADAVPDPGEPVAQRAAILALLREQVAAAEEPLHLPALGKRIHQLGGAWIRQSRFGGAGTLAKLIEGAEGLALEAGPGGGWLYDPARHARPSLRQPGLADDPLSRLMADLRAALGPALEVPQIGPVELDFALRRLAGMLPQAGPPGAEARAALAAEAMGAGLDLPARAIEALALWLNRARVDWRSPADEETPARFGRALFAEITRQAAAAGARLPPDTLAALREWIGLGPRPGPEPAPEEASPAPPG